MPDMMGGETSAASAAARRLIAGRDYLAPAAYLEHTRRHPPVFVSPESLPERLIGAARKLADAPEAAAASEGGGAPSVFQGEGETASFLLEPRGEVFQAMKDFVGTLNGRYWKFPEPLTYPTFRVNLYREGGRFDWHQDLYGPDSEATARAVTAVLLLDPAGSYEGGEFEIEGWDGGIESLRPDQGGMFAFPACHLHRVKPVKKGRRRALALSVAAAIKKDGMEFARVKIESRTPELEAARTREMTDLLMRRRDLLQAQR